MRFFQFCNYDYFDRPFERTITMQKDSNGFVGFVFDDGRIKSLVKDSSAARNGLLTDHQLIEIDGQNVVGLKVGGVDTDQTIVKYDDTEHIAQN